MMAVTSQRGADDTSFFGDNFKRIDSFNCCRISLNDEFNCSDVDY
jgi:hypothetical protein